MCTEKVEVSWFTGPGDHATVCLPLNKGYGKKRQERAVLALPKNLIAATSVKRQDHIYPLEACGRQHMVEWAQLSHIIFKSVMLTFIFILLVQDFR